MSTILRRVFMVLSAIVLAVALAWWLGAAPETTTPPPAEHTSTQPDGLPHARPPAELLAAPVAGISGTVRDLDGKPLAGAQVCAFRLGPAWLFAERAPPQCSEAGPDGFYTLTGLAPLRHAIHASAPQHRPGRIESDLSLRPGEQRVDVDLALAPGGVRVTGVVQDVSGGVIDGAWVASGDGRDLGTAVTRSDAAGRFALWVRPGFAHLFGQADGYADASDHGGAPGDGFVIVLTPESVLVGRVVTAGTRAPVVGARVTVIGDLADGGAIGMGVAVTGADGQFRLTRLQPGRYKPTVQAEGGHGEAERSVHLGLGETSDPVTIVVHPVASVAGRIAVAGGQGGCPRGEVILSARTGIQTLVESTDETGAVVFPAVRPDIYEVQIVCPGYVVPSSFPTVTVTQTPVTGLVWELASGRAIRGTVVDAHGRGMPGLSVSAHNDGPDPSARTRGYAVDEATDAAGRFEVAGLLPGAYSLQVYGEGINTAQQPVTTVLDAARDTEDVRIALPESGEIHGIVVDERGDPAGRVQVMIRGPEGILTGAMTAGDGEFLVTGLPPGDYQAHAQRFGAGMPGETPENEVSTRVVADGTAELRLLLTGARAQIRGRVMHADGNPVTDAFVTGVHERPGMDLRMELRWGGFERPVLTDADGNFALTGLVDGDHALRAYRRGGGEALAEHVATGTTTTLTITPTAEVGGTISEPVPDELGIYIVDNATMVQRIEEFYRTEGRWGFDALPAGTYDLFFESATGTAKQTITLRADDRRTDLRVSLSAPGSIRGRVLDATTGAPQSGVRLEARPMEGRTRFSLPSGEVTSDADGRFEISRVTAGLINLSARGGGVSFIGSDQQVTVESGRSVEVNVTVEDLTDRGASE